MPRRSGERGGCPPWSSRRQAFPEPVRLTFVAEADGDLLTVVAVGATNSIRRRYLGLQSGLHTLIGGVLAVPLTLLLYKTVMMAGGGYQTVGNFGVWDSARLILPWSGLVLLLLGLPLAIGLVTSPAVRSALTTPPRRTS